ncbi:MAG: hypothetical protein PVF74_13195 [Anaerolineales bacterium]|jgi:hypothetical protein
MKKEQLLTVRWNNLLTLGLGLIILLYAYFVFTSSALSEIATFIGLVVLGAFY